MLVTAAQASVAVDANWANKFNFYYPSGAEAGNTRAVNQNTVMTVAVLPEGAEVEIFNGSAYAVTIATSPVNSVGPDGRTYTLAGLMGGVGTSLASKAAAVIKQVRSTSIATASLATTAPIVAVVGGLT